MRVLIYSEPISGVCLVSGLNVSQSNIVWHQQSVDKAQRRRQQGHSSCVLWFTGLSGSGKSTLASALDAYLFQCQVRSYVLDGDNIRHGLNKGLGFSPADRTENIRRIGEVSKLFVDAGTVVSTAFISPYRGDRDGVRQLFDPSEFIEIFVDCPLDVCESRDVKGLYQKARDGVIPEFTGISAPYEEPLSPELVLKTAENSLEHCVEQVYQLLLNRKILVS